MIVERDCDDVARCFALQRLLHERGHHEPFAGEITGLISAGAFLSFDARTDIAPRFQGMLPVRRLSVPADGAREWWEINEQGTILHGEHTGATLRLGDALDVRVGRVDTVRGRVDLEPAP
jgi:exoribonuclease R